MFAIVPSRQIPLSPSSPPSETRLSPSPPSSDRKRRPSETLPRSPVSPPLMSVATKSYVSSYGNNQHTDEMAQRLSPRSPATNPTHQPAKLNPPSSSHEQHGTKRSSPDDDGNEHRDKRQRLTATNLTEDRMDMDSSTTHSNHQRQLAPSQTLDGSIGADSGNVSGGYFLLGQSPIPRSKPDPRQHLLATYGLSALLQSVARTDPLSGEKINKLRKSYEGQIKMFGLAGRNKPVKAEREEDEPGPLRKLAIVHDVEWDGGVGSSKVEVTSDFRAQLEKAMQLQPGTVRNNAHWEDVLGHEKPRLNPPTTLSQQPPRIANGVSRGPPGNALGDRRATRGKKRSYGDESFVGYGEGFSEGEDIVDDEDDQTRRKRKKYSFGASAPHDR